MASVDDHAAAILTAACGTARAILARRAALDAAGRESETLFVPVGELHAGLAHKLHMMALITRLQAAEPRTVFCEEAPHHYLADLLSSRPLQTGADFARAAALRDRDPDGRLTLMARISDDCYIEAPYTAAALYKLLLDSRIRARFTDCAHDAENRLIAADGSTRAALRAAGESTRFPVKVRDINGVAARNEHMTLMAAQFAAQHNARIAVQLCGNNHVAGAMANYDPARSLSGCWKREGKPVLAVFHRKPDDPDFFRRLSVLDRDEIAVKGPMPDLWAYYPPGIKPTHSFSNEDEERLYTDAVMQRMGLGAYCFDGARSLEAIRDDYCARVRHAVPRLRPEAA